MELVFLVQFICCTPNDGDKSFSKASPRFLAFLLLSSNDLFSLSSDKRMFPLFVSLRCERCGSCSASLGFCTFSHSCSLHRAREGDSDDWNSFPADNVVVIFQVGP